MLLDDTIGRTQIEAVAHAPFYLRCSIFVRDPKNPNKPTVIREDTFRLVELNGKESVSTPFEFELTLHANTESTVTQTLVFKDLLGSRISVVMGRAVAPKKKQPGDTATAEQATQQPRSVPSIFNGMVAAFAMHEPGVYKLTMRPALWKLTLANRYRVYRQKNIRDTLRELCELHGVKVDFRNMDDERTYNLATSRKQDWLQLGETDYDFLQRLLNKAHLYYYFEHHGNEHTVVFANDMEYPRIAGTTALRYTFTSIDALGRHQSDVIADYSYQQTLSQNGLSGAFTREEEAWAQDGVATFHTIFKSAGDSTAEPTFRLHKIYQYDVPEELATDYTSVAADALRTAASQFSGSSFCSQMRAGYAFQAIQPPRQDPKGWECYPQIVRPSLDAELNGRWFVLTQVQHKATLDGEYRNQFVAAGADGSLSAFSTHDTHQGTVLAKVVAHGKGVPPNDWRYYKKNNFDPEQSKATDIDAPEPTSLQGVYVRFASDPPTADAIWVKLSAQMQSAPEIGALVVVTRANDESELPEIQYIVEAGGQMTVTPSRWMADTRVGSNYSTAYGDSKSIHYGNDSPVELQKAIDLVEKKYNSKQYRDVSYSVGGHYSYETANKGRSGLLNDSESYGSTYSRAEGAERKNYEDIDYTRSESVVGAADSYSTVKNRNYSETKLGSSESHHTVETTNKNYETIKGTNYSSSEYLSSNETHSAVTGESKSYETFKAKRYTESLSQGDVENHSTTKGKSTNYETIDGAHYTSSTSNSTVENHSTVSGKSSSYETFNGGRYNEQTVHGTSESMTTVTGTDKSTSHIAIANHNNAIGISNDNNTMGLVFNTNLIGTTTDLRVAANVNQVNATGIAAEVNLYIALYRTEKVGFHLGMKNKSPASADISNNGMEIEMTELKTIL